MRSSSDSGAWVALVYPLRSVNRPISLGAFVAVDGLRVVFPIAAKDLLPPAGGSARRMRLALAREKHGREQEICSPFLEHHFSIDPDTRMSTFFFSCIER